MNTKNDCGVVAISVACNISYRKAYLALKECGRVDGRGTSDRKMLAALEKLGCEPRRLRKHWLTEYRTVRSLGKNLPPRGSFIIRTPDHWSVARDGKICDWSAGRLLRVRRLWRID